MTKTDILKVIDEYQSRLSRNYDVPAEARFDELSKSPDVVGRHLLSMCSEMRKILAQVRDRPYLTAESEAAWQKVNRWLGFMQGVFWADAIFTLAEMRQHNNPDCEAK